MSKKKESSGVGKSSSPKIKRPGVHSKKKSSNSKNSKNYKKKYKGQG